MDDKGNKQNENYQRQKQKKGKSRPTRRKRVQRTKNKTRKMIRQAQEDYYKVLFDEKQNGMKQMWKHLGSILNPKRTNKILRLFANNTSITENSEIAETLNQHFC